MPTKRVWLLRTYARKRAVPSQVLSQCRSKSRATVVGWPSSRLTRPTGPTRAGQLPPIARERQCPSQAAVDRCPTGPVMRVHIKKFLIYERLGLRKQRWCGVSGQGGRDRGSADAPVALTESLDRMTSCKGRNKKQLDCCSHIFALVGEVFCSAELLQPFGRPQGVA